MAVKSRELTGGKGTAGGKVVAVLAWCVGVWATVEFLNGLSDSTGSQLILAAALVQAIFTWGESPIWSGRGRWWNVGMLVLDTLTNIGGLFFFVMRIDQTESWAALNIGLGTSGGLNPLAALVISGVLGVLLAATPEFLWKQS